MMPKKLITLCALGGVIGFAIGASVWAGEGVPATSFRFLALGIPKAQLLNAQSNFTALDQDGAVVFKDGSKECARALIGPDDRVTALNLYPCFFVADGMSLDAFTERFAKSYRIQNLKPLSDQAGYVTTRGFRGQAPSGEDISIVQLGTQDPGGKMVWWDGLQVKVRKPINPNFE